MFHWSIKSFDHDGIPGTTKDNSSLKRTQAESVPCRREGACERPQHYTVASEIISLPSADKKWAQRASTITSSTSLGTAQPGHRIPKHDRETLWDTGEMGKEESLC